MTKKKKNSKEEAKRQGEQAQKDKDGFKKFMSELEELEKGQQELIKTIVGKICNVIC